MSRWIRAARRALTGLFWILTNPMTALRAGRAFSRNDAVGLVALVESPSRSRDFVRQLRRQGVTEFRFRRDNMVWWTDTGDEIGEELWCTGEYEGREIGALVAWARRNDRSDGVVIDVGANIGTTSVPLAQQGYRVLAIEPMQRTFEMLTTNVRDNGLDDRITCVNMAVAEIDGDIEMWSGFGSGQAEVAVEGQDPAMTRWGDRGVLTVVRAAPLASIVSDAGVDFESVSFVWADVQGCETGIVRSGRALWEAGVPLYVEVDPVALEVHGGLTLFIQAVTSNFTRFVDRAELLQEGATRPIEDFASWVDTIDETSYSDALLLPGPC